MLHSHPDRMKRLFGEHTQISNEGPSFAHHQTPEADLIQMHQAFDALIQTLPGRESPIAGADFVTDNGKPYCIVLGLGLTCAETIDKVLSPIPATAKALVDAMHEAGSKSATITILLGSTPVTIAVGAGEKAEALRNAAEAIT